MERPILGRGRNQTRRIRRRTPHHAALLIDGKRSSPVGSPAVRRRILIMMTNRRLRAVLKWLWRSPSLPPLFAQRVRNRLKLSCLAHFRERKSAHKSAQVTHSNWVRNSTKSGQVERVRNFKRTRSLAVYTKR